MERYKKKPLIIEAERWFEVTYDREAGHAYGGHASPVYHLDVGFYRHPDNKGTNVCEHCGLTMHLHGWIDTLEGGHTVCPGDWIIQGVMGEMYPCKDVVFKMTYEKYIGDGLSISIDGYEGCATATGKKDTEERNPAHYCFGCDEYLGFRGFCSDKCHNEHYDALLETEEILSDSDLMAGIIKSVSEIQQGKTIPLSELYPEKEMVVDIAWGNFYD